MLFNSNVFLYIFLPALLILYYASVAISKGKTRVGNVIVLAFSLLFYVCTGGVCTWILLGVVLINYIFGFVIEKTKSFTGKKAVIVSAVLANIGILAYFKYAAFIYDNFSLVVQMFDSSFVKQSVNVILPVGISFFVFQAMSYVIDVYRGEVAAQKNFFDFLLYISLFPQLIAGPIVRYKTVCAEISDRKIILDDIYDGAFRFITGLGKKVLIADMLGTVVDGIWGLSASELTTPLAWSAAFLYTLQIYFDFSGYSDMAIGLGKMLGFHFQENFVQPYTASNISEFWRRWHISLSSFLKDYLYIPLGGNRRGVVITYRNLVIVFLVCGLWHGAAWNFVVWGLYHGLFQVIERILKNKFNFEMKGVFGRCVTFLIVMIGWVIFRAESLGSATQFYKVMMGESQVSGWQFYSFNYYVYFKVIITAGLAFAASFFKLEKLREKMNNNVVKGIAMVVILVLSMAFMSDASFTPFIYFQF